MIPVDLISVIVPVYKVEEYLDRCVQSIVDQTYQNLEIILVDDGSPDHCPAMCDAWAAKDNRIKVIHKKNGGGAQARNVGLDAAQGEYIGFVDSDDFIDPEMYQYLYQILIRTDSDIAECGYHITDSGSFPDEMEYENKIVVLNTEDALRENINDCICRQLLWNKLYKKKSIGDIRMVEGKTIDDEFFTYRVLAEASKVAIGDRKLYVYRQQNNSIMHQAYSVKWLDAVEARYERIMFLKERFPSLATSASVALLFTCLYHGQLTLKHLQGQQKKHALQLLKDTYRNVPLDVKALPLTHKCWLMLAKLNFELCCNIRNNLGVGI